MICATNQIPLGDNTGNFRYDAKTAHIDSQPYKICSAA